ncbi:hypothetical protein PMALA_034550 [Plasmodium malariae]|uniref:OTU domain-containing protein n=1 Tax=Plasmodium malariae TaxID=5858 RepID=A0A1A8WG25_PLAMA|nr:hypothetical protein PMALA_034550 [Plasmodium malariae]
MVNEEKELMSYHEYKRRVKKITEELKREKKKTINKSKKSENLLKLEEELNRLIVLYNNKGSNNNKRGEGEEEKEEIEKDNNLSFTDNLYSYNEISKKMLKNKKKTQLKELEEELNEKSKNKIGEVEYNELLETLKKLNKTIYSIAPDGNCLYESILHQLRQRRTNNYEFSRRDFLNQLSEDNFSLEKVDLKNYENKKNFDFTIFTDINPYDLNSEILRFLTAIYILQNEEIFKYFIYNEDDYADNDVYFSYCQGITNGVYGSEIEIKALSNILQKKITVFDTNMNISYESITTQLLIFKRKSRAQILCTYINIKEYPSIWVRAIFMLKWNGISILPQNRYANVRNRKEET